MHALAMLFASAFAKTDHSHSGSGWGTDTLDITPRHQSTHWALQPSMRKLLQILVFSTWADVLELLQHAFQTHGVPFVYGKGKLGLQGALERFRDDSTDFLRVAAAEVGAQAWAPSETPSPSAPPLAPNPAKPGEALNDVASLGVASPSHPAPGQVTVMPPPNAATDNGKHAGSAKAKRVLPPFPSSRTTAKDANVNEPRVMLLSLKQAGAGLNLTEAQHAILVEPTTNPALEAQAVGRVHRIGQTRDTHVHRFVVDHSVEASLHRLSAQKAAKMDMSQANPGALAAAEQALTLSDVGVMLFQEPIHGVPAPQSSEDHTATAV